MENVKTPNCIYPGRIRKIIARRSLILDPCNDEASGILVCRNDFLPFRSIDPDRRATRLCDHSRLPLPRSLVEQPRGVIQRGTHIGIQTHYARTAIVRKTAAATAVARSRSAGNLPRCFPIERLSRDPFDKPCLAGRTTPRGIGAEANQAEPSRAEPRCIFPWNDYSHKGLVQCQEHASHTDIQCTARHVRPFSRSVRALRARNGSASGAERGAFLPELLYSVLLLLTSYHAGLWKRGFFGKRKKYT